LRTFRSSASVRCGVTIVAPLVTIRAINGPADVELSSAIDYSEDIFALVVCSRVRSAICQRPKEYLGQVRPRTGHADSHLLIAKIRTSAVVVVNHSIETIYRISDR
jgi:hypothetical protein